MSGGSFDYMYSKIEDTYVGFLEDDELNEMMSDLCDLLKSLEWYKSCDTSEEDYINDKKKLKEKWFGKRDKLLVDNIIKRLLETIDGIKKS